MSDLPASVAIREVGPRDGFQNEPEVIATDDKVRLIDQLARTGLRRLEATSFVRADVIPQLADAAEVLARIDVPDEVEVTVLIPNERGFDNALAQRDRFSEINCFLSASESHNHANVNRSIEESLTGLEHVIRRAVGEGLRAEGVISVSFGCPYEGHVPPERVFAIAERLAAAGAAEIGFGDTTGMANPLQVGEFFAAAGEALPGVQLTAHFHNTRGQGLANVLAALTPAARRSSRASASSVAAPSRPARPATSPPRTSSRCSTRWGSRLRSTFPPCSRPPEPCATSWGDRWGRTRSSRAPSTGMRDLGPVLIANRGEIAVRIARTVRDLGLASVAVVTPADAGAPHADVADVAVAVDSYLDAAEILRAAARPEPVRCTRATASWLRIRRSRAR